MLSFEEWLTVCQDDIDIELAENGADRELDFDPESEYERRYDIMDSTLNISIIMIEFKAVDSTKIVPY